MDSIASAASNRVYEDFDPSTEWKREALTDTLIVYLPGFRKEQLKVQISSDNNLRISGSRQLNDNIWSRFRKEIPIPSNYDTKGISANFEKGILYVRNSKLIVPKSPAPSEFSKPASDQATKPPQELQEIPNPTKEVIPETQVRRIYASEEPRYESSTKLKKIAKGGSYEPEAPKLQKTTEQIKQSTAEPSKPLQEPSKPEKPPKEEPSKLLQAPKWEKPSQETPKPAKEEPSKLEKPRTEKEEKEQVVRTRKVTTKVATSEQENAGKMERAEALPGINESGSSRFALESYKNSISGLMKEMKNARNATNMVLAILFGIVLALYTKNAVRSFMKSED